MQKCKADGDLLPVLTYYSSAIFAENNLKCAEKMRAGDIAAAREYAFIAKAAESLPQEFIAFVEKTISERS